MSNKRKKSKQLNDISKNTSESPLLESSLQAARSSAPTPPPSIIEFRQEWWLALLILTLTFASFFPSLKNEFVGWDDSGMFTENIEYRGLKWANIKWMFTTFHYAHYHPITWLTLGLDYEIWKMNPMGYHLTSLIIHSLNAVLLYFLIKAFLRITQTFSTSSHELFFRLCCAAGALVFAIHPLRVESVAWATERRDVLSGFFYILTLLAYLNAQTHEALRKRWLALSVTFFLLSFLSKAWGITLPVVLLILDIYPLRRLQTGKASLQKLLLEKAPFFVIAISLAIVAFIGQKDWGIESQPLNLLKRLAITAYGLCFYLWQTLVPTKLSTLYLLPRNLNPLQLKYILCGAALLGVTIFLFAMRRRWPWALTAWLCYGFIVSPVIGLTHKGDQIAADRYTYLCLLPLPVLIAAGLFRMTLAKREKKLQGGTFVFTLTVTAIGLITLSILTFRQTKTWKNDFTLWDQVLKVEPDNFIGYNGRGRILMESGKQKEAIADFDVAIQLNPKLVSALNNRGKARYEQGDVDAALVDFTAAIKVRPQAETLNNRGALKEIRGDPKGAIEDYTKALQLNPHFPNAFYNRARLRKQQGDMDGALGDFMAAIKYNPAWPDAYYRLGDLLKLKGNLQAAMQSYDTALRLAPANWSEREGLITKRTELQAMLNK